MSAAGTQVAVPAPRPFSFLRGFRIIPRLETFPTVVTFARTIVGKVTILALFGLGLYYATWLHYIHNPRWIVQICFLVAVTALPRHRRIVLALGTFGWAFGIWWQWAERPQIVQAAVSVVCAALIFLSAIRFRNTWFGRRPVATLLTGFALTVFVASYLPRGGSLRTTGLRFPTRSGGISLVSRLLADGHHCEAPRLGRFAGRGVSARLGIHGHALSQGIGLPPPH